MDHHTPVTSGEPRTRNRGAYVANQCVYVYTPKVGNPTTTIWSVNSGIVSQMQDCVVPDYKKRVANGEIFNNPLLVVTDELFSNDLGARFRSTGTAPYSYYDYGNHWGPLVCGRGSFATHPESFDDIILEAQTRARANIAPPQYEGGIALGELRENLRYIANPFKSGMKLATNFQKKKVKRLRSVEADLRKVGISNPRVYSEEILVRKLKELGKDGIANDLSNIYLEIRLGLIPLVGDLSSLATALSDLHSKPDRKTFRAKEERVFSDDRVYSLVNGGFTYNFSEKEECIVRVNAGALCEYLTEFESPYEKYGIAFHDIPSALWETIPLSFIVDNFVNIGTFIKALRPVPSVEQLSSFTTVTVERSIVRTWTSATSSTATTVRQPSGTWGKKYITKTRHGGLGTLPVVTWRNGSINRFFTDPFKVLDLITLIKQRLI